MSSLSSQKTPQVN